MIIHRSISFSLVSQVTTLKKKLFIMGFLEIHDQHL